MQDLERHASHAPRPRGVLFLAALEPNTAAANMSCRMAKYHENASGGLIRVLQALPEDANIVVVTEGGVPC